MLIIKIMLRCIIEGLIGLFWGTLSAVVIGIVSIPISIIAESKGWSWADEVLIIIALLCFCAGPLIGFFFPLYDEIMTLKNEKERARREEEEHHHKELKRKQDALEAECRSLTKMLNESRSTFWTLPRLIGSAKDHLDKAEYEFSDGAFVPFWEEVEHVLNCLGAYHNGVKSISRNAREYSTRRSKLSISIPEFAMPNKDIPDARPVAVRLSEIVRKGYKDPDFSKIYLQMKTNRLLYSGFGTLAIGLERAHSLIADALDDFPA